MRQVELKSNKNMEQQQQQQHAEFSKFDDALMGHFNDLLAYGEEQMPDQYKELRKSLLEQLESKQDFAAAVKTVPPADKEKFIRRFMYIVFIGMIVQKKKEDIDFVNLCLSLCDERLASEKDVVNEKKLALIMDVVDKAEFWTDKTVIPQMHAAVRNVINSSTVEQRYALVSFCCFFFDQFSFDASNKN